MRGGFTLVELMVVIGILLVLGAMSVAIIPRVTEGQYTIQAATQLQQWCEIAKQMAAQDRAPRGIRIMPHPAYAEDPVGNPEKKWQVVSLEFLEQPGLYTLGDLTTGGPSLATANGVNVTFSATSSKTLTFTGAAPGLEPVRAGDYLELAGIVYKIAGLPTSPRTLVLTTPAPQITTSNYRIIRQPRPMGEEPLLMPKNIIIDLKSHMSGLDSAWVPPAVFPVDIMFGPDGRVLGSMAARDKIIFWVRDVTMNEPEGDPTLVVIYPATGLIAAHPVDLGYYDLDPTYKSLSPYTFTATGKRSSQ